MGDDVAPTVKCVLWVETIRDGGSLAAAFLDDDGSEWILFLKIHQVLQENRLERLGFKEPVLIDADPAKRPIDTETLRFSALSGPARSLTWEEAQAFVGQIAGLATSLNEWAAESLNHLRIAVDSRGDLPSDMARYLPTRRFSRT